MSNRRDPGPPLVAEEEFCASQPPGASEYIKASGAALAALLGGAVIWVGLVLLVQQVSGFTALLVALGTGWLVHRAAGRHRSVGLGIIAAVSSVLAVLLGFALLWLPLFDRMKLPRQLDWYQVSMLVLGAVAAYHLAGPRDRRSKSL